MPGKKLSPKDLENFSTQLTMSLNLLRGDMSQLELDALDGGKPMKFQGDDGDSYDVEFSLELLELDENTAQEIEDALERLKGGTYGRCEDCGHWLTKDRLRSVPYARRCITCQSAAEAARA